MKIGHQMHNFICPNCGSSVSTETTYISRDYCPDDPWSSILQTIKCALCSHTIPAHLGERWDNISMEEARKEWLELYKESSQKEPRR